MPRDLSNLDGDVRYVRTGEESKALTANPMPKVIISASGMATGGRVLHHLEHYAPDPKNAILFTGFQAGGTRGAAMVAGAQSIKMHGGYVPVRAEVHNLSMLSAHADQDELLRWAGGFEDAAAHRPSSSMASRRAPMRCATRWKKSWAGIAWCPIIGQTVELVMSRACTAIACRPRRLGIDTHSETVVFLHKDCPVCRSEGFHSHNRILLCRRASAMSSPRFIRWNRISSAATRPGFRTPPGGPWASRRATPSPRGMRRRWIPWAWCAAASSAMRWTRRLSSDIIPDIVAGRYSAIEISSFVTACAAKPLSHDEICALTRAMVRCRRTAALGPAHHRRQAFGRRPAGQPHHADHRRHRRRARADHAQDLVARHHLAGRDRRHDGDPGAGRSGRDAMRDVVEQRRRLHRLGRRGAA